MKYGCCVNLLPKQEDQTGLEYAVALRELGYDYVELPLNELTKLDEAEFSRAADRLRQSGLLCRSCNNFMPPELRLAGPDPAPKERLADYLRLAMGRLSRLGAGITVFGSPWSRSCPAGFSQELAFEQLAEFLRTAGDEAARRGIVVAIEHNNSGETNMLNHFSDAVRMVRAVNHPSVKVLCDYYHLRVEGDAPELLLGGGGEFLVHTHIAQLENRRYPTDLFQEPMLPRYARILRQLGYDGGISVEGKVDRRESWRGDAGAALELLHRNFD